eukprot:XP_015575268.1 DNA polymerase lambda isoform X1 [Ricinus communis]
MYGGGEESCRGRGNQVEESKLPMAPKATAKNKTPSRDPNGMFSGMVVFLVENGVQSRRLQIWKQKLVQMGATIETRLSKKVTHVLAMNSNALLQQLDKERLQRLKVKVLVYQWLEDSLRLGKKVSEETYNVEVDLEEQSNKKQSLVGESTDGNASSGDEPSPRNKKVRSSSLEDNKNKPGEDDNALIEEPNSPSASSDSSDLTLSRASIGMKTPSNSPSNDPSSAYCPPDLNRNITEIFGKLINIYRALGDDRRSFSYYKAIPVTEKLPFKIESADQVKNLPGIGKSLQDNIQEIVTTGKLSKLEHFETDEKVVICRH